MCNCVLALRATIVLAEFKQHFLHTIYPFQIFVHDYYNHIPTLTSDT